MDVWKLTMFCGSPCITCATIRRYITTMRPPKTQWKQSIIIETHGEQSLIITGTQPSPWSKLESESKPIENDNKELMNLN